MRTKHWYSFFTKKMLRKLEGYEARNLEELTTLRESMQREMEKYAVPKMKLNEKQVDLLRNMYDEIDTDSSGFIDHEELSEFLDKICFTYDV